MNLFNKITQIFENIIFTKGKKIFACVFFVVIFLNILSPVFYVKFLYSNTQNGNSANNQKSLNIAYAQQKTLSKEEIAAKIRPEIISLLDRAKVDTSNLLTRAETGTTQQLVLKAALKYLTENKDSLIAVYDNEIKSGKDYIVSLEKVIEKINNDIKSDVYDYMLNNGFVSKKIKPDSADFNVNNTAGAYSYSNAIQEYNKVVAEYNQHNSSIKNLVDNLDSIRSDASNFFGNAKEMTDQEVKDVLSENKKKAQENSKDLLSACSDDELGTIGSGLCNAIWFILEAIVGAVAGLAYITIKVFEFAISEYILNIKSIFDVNATSYGSGLSDQNLIFIMWKMSRDIVNVLVFFAAVYIGIRRILGEESDFLKNIIRVLLFALLVNFSYPIAKFLIDISNVVSLFIYNSIVSVEIAGKGGGLADVVLANIGFGFMTKIFGSGQAINITDNFSSPSPWLSLGLVFVLALVMSFVFVFLSVMILVRAVILVICVIFSPLMFAVGFMGKMDELHKKWIEHFFNNLIFSPIIMLGLYIILNILISTGSKGTDIVSTTDMQSLGRLIFAMVGFVLVYMMAKMLSGSIGAAIGGVMSKASMIAGSFIGGGIIAGGAVKGAGALMGRISSSKLVQNAANNKNSTFRRGLANTFIGATDKVQNMKAGAGRFARPTNYAQDIKNTNFKTMNENQDIIKSLKPEQQEKITDAFNNSRTVAGSKKIGENIKTVANIENDFNKKIMTDKLVDNPLNNDYIEKYKKADNYVTAQEATQKSSDSEKQQPSDALRNLRIARQNVINDAIGADRARTVEEQNATKERIKQERLSREEKGQNKNSLSELRQKEEQIKNGQL